MKNSYLVAGLFVVILGLCSCKTTSSSSKKPDSDITDKYWKLVEIEGQPVVVEEWMREEPHIILRKENNRVTGTSGCNGFNGTYEIKEGSRISFSQMAATMMACINMDVEQKMLRVFEMADNYTVSADGKYLSLNRARMAPLARFEVVYMK
jgi:heat shock protein HslJ